MIHPPGTSVAPFGADRLDMRFHDRTDAGRQLGARLSSYANRHDVIVLALPRGGVPVAFEVAQELNAPLDIFLVRKLGVPQQPELAFGAIASGGLKILNPEIVNDAGLTPTDIKQVTDAERAELDRRERLYRGGSEPIDIE